MTELRPIRGVEADEFLELLCHVFELQIDRARGIFFNEPLFELNRKWGYWEEGRLVSILTTVPLEFGWGRAIGIAGVATHPDFRRRGIAEELVTRALQASAEVGESSAFLFAQDPRMYQRAGFSILDEVVSIDLPTSAPQDDSLLLSMDEVRLIYDRWSAAGQNRLRRDERRWRYWTWNLRLCSALGDGYVCFEGATIREAITFGLPIPGSPEPSQFVGLRSMAAHLGINTSSASPIMFLMGKGASEPPEMFLTDQF
jgi:GNAT superfamily N-acetyltransferase